ncbi:diguanylate cyclase (GGDEF) domain-containing protein [Hoeflea sp. IMCC20628]|uniref:DUF1883 domain-containing protein n=1 Tax=Hoeflea sp. IMCC20628 TaxID=1620421 RepID=UPI00063BE27D|nr:DUF1883 domain-containing protein [Hoeflea sp. IMCC20628]AKI00290.1 diguanylate cyclase (GGDEF) domain-containing protein [Hoeflea sp. IMCC20628]
MDFSPRYKCYALGKQTAGTVVEVVLSCINNIRLMDQANFQRYSENKTFQFIGGRTEKSPARFTVPRTANWHVVVDKIDFDTLANSNVRTISPKSPKPAGSSSGYKAGTSNSVSRDPSGNRFARPDSEAYVVTRILRELNEYKQIANTDALTGLSNRRAFDTRMTQVFGDPQNLPTTALILTDIDHFKSFNDRFGHAVGDRVLKIVAEKIRESLPASAFPARTGGEEFGIIVEVASQNAAYEIAELARSAVEITAFLNKAGGTDCGRVTISLGICMADNAMTIEDLYNKADQALYASKKDGRNKSTVFEDDMLDDSASSVADTTTIIPHRSSARLM